MEHRSKASRTDYRSMLWRWPLRIELVERCTAAGPAAAGCCPGCGRAQRRRQAPWQAVYKACGEKTRLLHGSGCTLWWGREGVAGQKQVKQ